MRNVQVESERRRDVRAALRTMCANMLESRAVKTRRAAANNFRDSGTICLGLNLLLLILLNVFVNVLREVQIAINITGVWILRVGTDWELLLGLPLANPFRTRWVVVTGLDLTEERFGLHLVKTGVHAKLGQEFILVQEVTGNHRKDNRP